MSLVSVGTGIRSFNDRPHEDQFFTKGFCAACPGHVSAVGTCTDYARVATAAEVKDLKVLRMHPTGIPKRA